MKHRTRKIVVRAYHVNRTDDAPDWLPEHEFFTHPKYGLRLRMNIPEQRPTFAHRNDWVLLTSSGDVLVCPDPVFRLVFVAQEEKVSEEVTA